MTTHVQHNITVPTNVILINGARIDDFIPGTLVFIRKPKKDEERYHSGRLLPIAQCNDLQDAKPYGIIGETQHNLRQPLAPFQVYRLDIIIAGQAPSLIPITDTDLYTTMAAIVHRKHTHWGIKPHYNIGRIIGFNVFTLPTPYIPQQTIAQIPKRGTLCARVSVHIQP